MPIRFGDLAPAGGIKLDNGMYDATIAKIVIVMENGAPKKNDNGKPLLDVFYQLDEENTIKRRYSVSLGQNSANKQWAAFAKVIEAATRVKCGDPGQQDVTDEQMIGRAVRIVIEQNDRGYADVVNVLATAQPQPVRQAPKPAPAPVDEEFAEIPF